MIFWKGVLNIMKWKMSRIGEFKKLVGVTVCYAKMAYNIFWLHCSANLGDLIGCVVKIM